MRKKDLIRLSKCSQLSSAVPNRSSEPSVDLNRAQTTQKAPVHRCLWPFPDSCSKPSVTSFLSHSHKLYFHIAFHLMRSSLHIFLTLLCLTGCVADVNAQSSAAPTPLMTELCGCMSAIDLDASDRTVEASVRNCMEEAVVMHPLEVRSILRDRPTNGSKAFQLGTALGGALQHMCQPFNLVRERLQRIPPSAKPVRQGT